MGISANELVMRARDSVYHVQCFTCVSCNKTLATGDHFGMRDGLIYCRTHYEIIMTHSPEYMSSPGGSISPGALSSTGGTPPGGIQFYNGVTGGSQKGRPRKRKSPGPDADCALSLGMFTTIATVHQCFSIFI